MLALKYPLEIADGRLVLSDQYGAIISQNILAALQTYQEERVMRPDEFLPRMVLNSADTLPDILRSVRQAVSDALAEDFPEVQYSVLGSIQDDGSVFVSVRWHSDQDQNLVEFVIS